MDFTSLFGQVILPTVNFSADISSNAIDMMGSNSLWGRTLLFEGPNTLCATIMVCVLI